MANTLAGMVVGRCRIVSPHARVHRTVLYWCQTLPRRHEGGLSLVPTLQVSEMPRVEGSHIPPNLQALRSPPQLMICRQRSR